MTGKRGKKTHKVHKSHEKLKRFFLILLLVICTAAVISIGVLIGMYASALKEIQAMNVQNLAINYSSVIYYTDEDGNAHEMEKIYNDGNRIWLDSDKIPPIMKNAIVAIEDERFYEHNGVDIKRTTGAFFGWVKAKITGGSTSYGGSTITQQVIKNITQQKNKTAARKIKEMLLAVALEKELSKDEILTVYLNLICLANNCYGVEAAANMYYDKDAMELNLNEAATIAGITQRPEYYNPLKNPDNAKYKRDVVLTKMCELEMISVEERDETMQKGLELNDTYKEMRARIFSYFTDNLLNEVISDLQEEKGYSKDMAEQLVYSGGLSIYATVDPKIQNITENFYKNKSNFPSIKKEAQSAMIIMDPYTGEVKAMAGGIGEKTTSRGLNRATQSKLQPGSSIKPISVYGPAIEEDLINSTTGVLDAELKIGDWSPKNAYDGYKGTISVKRAVQISSNTAAVRTLQKLTVSKSYDYLKNKFGITSLAESDKNLSPLALGGLTNGVTPEEMAAAYSVFANGGIYIEPHSYSKVVDNSGNVLLEKSSKGKRVIKDSTAYIITDILGSVVNGASGTGKLAKLSKMPTYGKTGTTQENRDKWFVGYTPYYVGAVWYGFDQPDSINKYGVTYAVSAKIWGQVMEKVHEGLTVRDFEPPDSVVKKGNDYFAEDSKLKHGTSSASDYEASSSNKNKTRSSSTKKNESDDDDDDENITDRSDNDNSSADDNSSQDNNTSSQSPSHSENQGNNSESSSGGGTANSSSEDETISLD